MEETTDAVFKDVVVIGNGPSAITLSYMLDGNWPYYNGLPHPIDFLEYRLKEGGDTSIVEQDLQYLSAGLEGRSRNPVSVLFDDLNHPLADVGNDDSSVLAWMKSPNCQIDHIVLGKGVSGGVWQKMEGNALTISLGSWMELPALSIRRMRDKNTNRLLFGQSGFKQNRVTVRSVAKYYNHYVESQGLKKYFLDYATVTSVSKLTNAPVDTSDDECEKNVLWKVQGELFNSHDGKTTNFTYHTPNVVLATGNSDQHNKLNVDGDNLPFVMHSLAELEGVINRGELSSSSGNLLIVGAGLTAADAVITARFNGISTLHVFRRSVQDQELIFNKLPQNIYPEYHKVHQMMQDSNNSHYEDYKAFPMYRIHSINENHIVVLMPCNNEGLPCVVQASHVLVLIGMHPDLSFLPERGLTLGINQKLPVDCKKNPVAIDGYSYESIHHQGLYAVGPLVGDNFVRFVQGGALAITSHIWKKCKKDACI